MTCTVDGCRKPTAKNSRRMCSMHKSRLDRHGTTDLPAGRYPQHPGLPLAERLAIYSRPAANGCIEWTGYRNPNGYGCLNVDLHPRLAHRLNYELLVGPVAEGHDLDHLCRNRACINVEHLEPVTHQENMRRGLFGSKTQCPQGHPYTGENLIIKPGKRPGLMSRGCRTCKRARDRRRVRAAA